MGNKNNAPFRADIVGSFLRPAELKKARADYQENKITAEELKAVEDKCITELIGKEKAAGLQCVTDGEFRRSWWHLDFFWGFEGVEYQQAEQGYKFHDEETRAESASLSGKVRFNPSHPFFEHFTFAKKVAGDDVLTKQTIPSPSQFYMALSWPGNKHAIADFYADEEELYSDIADVYRKSILKFYELGCRNIQLDDCTWGMLCSREYMAAKGVTADAEQVKTLQALYVRLNNEAIADLPEDLVINTHVCRGNYHSTWAGSGSYEPVAESLFTKENVHAYYLEFDTERAGGFEPLRFVPENKLVVLGLITSKHPQLEEKEQIKQRIQEATQFVPLERLYLSPQCGFASTEEGNILTEEEQWNKVALVREIAAELWG